MLVPVAVSASLLLLGCVLGSLLAPQGAAAASGKAARAARPWRSVSAPTTTLALLDYVMQPLPDSGGEEEPDTSRAPREQNLPPAGEGQQPRNQPINQPSFGVPDTSRHGDSIRFPGGNPAALETLGPGSAIPSIPKAAASAPPPVKQRHGILGLHPLALLVGLIAFHIFIVTSVVK